MINRLYVHNYRCLENFTLDFDGNTSALLIGKNGAGKSTVLQCLGVFQEICRGSSRVGNLISAGDFTQHRLDHPMRFEIDVDLSGRTFNYGISFEWPANFREARILDEKLEVDGETIFDRQHAQIQLVGGAAFGLDWHVFALPVINERPGQRAIQDIKEFFASLILIAPIPSKMTGFSYEPSRELDRDAAEFASSLRGLLGQKPSAYTAFEDYVTSVVPDFSAIENVERGESGTQLIVKFKGEASQRTFSVEFKSLSDGEKCFFLSAFLIAANSTGSSVVCMWDEPDNHLSLSEVGQFIIALRKMANRGGQFIATTHHPETIRKFSDENTYVLSRKSHLDPTIVKPLANYPYTGDLINALIADEIVD